MKQKSVSNLRKKIDRIKLNIYVSLLKRIFSIKKGRELLLKKFKKKVYDVLVVKDKAFLKQVQLKKYEFLIAMLESAKRNLDKGFISKKVLNRIIDTLVNGALLKRDIQKQIKNKFKKKYGVFPPHFIVLSPTQRCNLHCVGCYASAKINAASLPYKVVDRIVGEVYHEWGSRFITISGGEPLMYQDNGKTLFDIWKKYKNIFFLFYTNGTFLTKDVAKKLASLGNVTPAISVEGFEKETDERRGKGIFKRILKAMENLREAGVPFGVSVTATAKNAKVLLGDKFYDFFFKEQGASYMWMFQLMPIGKAREMRELMITPKQRIKLYRKWENLLKKKKYCIADFWNSGVLSNGCIAYGRADQGYLYIDWNGNIMPCVFVPYYKDNVLDLYSKGKKLAHALFSDFFINGRKWQKNYGLKDTRKPNNWLMPCSIRDHWDTFRKSILPKDAKPEDTSAKLALKSKTYNKTLEKFDKELKKLTEPIWKKEYLKE